MSTTNPKKNGGRNGDGLTEKMRQAIAIVGFSATPRQGVLECEEKGICTRSTYYHRWTKNEHFVRAVNATREKAHGAQTDRNRALLRSISEDAIETLGDIARGEVVANKNQVKAIELVLIGAGMREYQRSSTVQVMQQFSSNDEQVRESRKIRLGDFLTSSERVTH